MSRRAPPHAGTCLPRRHSADNVALRATAPGLRHLASGEFLQHTRKRPPIGRPKSREETPKEGIATVVASPVYMGRELPDLRLVNLLPAIPSGKP
jgi:hypothetical protein